MNISKQARKWIPRITGFVLFALVFFSIYVYCVSRLEMDATAWMTLFLAIITGGVIWWQGRQLQTQLELQTLINLYEEWNSEEMRKYRCELCSLFSSENKSIIECSNVNLIKVEHVLEFLEKIASFYRKHVLSEKLIWATIGWDIMRYCFYTREAIIKIREKWGCDDSLYEDIEYLYGELMVIELSDRRNKDKNINNKEDIEKLFKGEIDKFRELECSYK